MKQYHTNINKRSRFTLTPEPDPAAAEHLAPFEPGQIKSRVEAALTIQNDFFPCFDWTFPPPITQRQTGTLSPGELFQAPSAVPGRYSLYLHIPYCATLCKFCYYPVMPGRAADEMDDYVGHLLQEMALYADVLADRKCESVYIGGGTPTYLHERQLTALFEALQRHFAFTPDAEITIESAPGTIPDAKLALLRQLGVNRLSYGIQTLDTDLLADLNRSYSVPAALRELEAAVATIGNVNIDTMYGFEGESDRALLDTLKQFVSLGIPCVSIYSLDGQRCERERVRFAPSQDPMFDRKLVIFRAARAYLHEQGFTPVLQNIFLKPDRASYRHQLRRWENLPLVALGMGSMGYAPRRLYQNHLSLKNYYAAVEAGQLPIVESEPLTAELEIAREMVSQLRFTQVDLARVRDKYGVDVGAVFEDLIDALVELGYVERRGDVIRLTNAAEPYNNIIPMLFAPDRFKEVIFALPEEYRENFPLPAVLANVGATQSRPIRAARP